MVVNPTIFQLQYFGTISYWKDILKSSILYIDSQSILNKITYANRTCILNSNGVLNLSIPLEGGRDNKIPYCNINIADYKIFNTHYKSLKSSYSKSSYYEYYIDLIFSTIETNRKKSLLDLNLSIHNIIFKLLKFSPSIEMTKDNFNQFYCPKIKNPTTVYKQTFDYKFDFIPDLSILDLIFNLGPHSKSFLTSI